MTRLFRHLLLLLVAFALVGGTTSELARAAAYGPVAAMANMPCDMAMPTSASGGDAPPMAPCKEKMPGCAQMLGCGVSASLKAPAVVATNEQVWTPAVYWPVASLLEGLHLKPDLGPPIVI